jgi:hypothetical protein
MSKIIRNQFTAKLPDNYVSAIDQNTPQEAKNVRNAQLETLVKEIMKRLVKPNITFDKKLIHVNSESTLKEIEIFLNTSDLVLEIPNLKFNAAPDMGYVYEDDFLSPKWPENPCRVESVTVQNCVNSKKYLLQNISKIDIMRR